MSILEEFGAYVADASADEDRETLRATVRLHLADTLAAWIAGSRTPEGRALIRLATGRGPNVIADGLLDRVTLHCALARLSEIDDIHLASATTPGAIVFPAVLTMGVGLERPREALEDAIVVGMEALTRLGAALDGPTILYRGFWPTYFAAPFGVAALTARLLDLSADEAAHALGLALVLSAPGTGHQSGASMSRWLAIGHAARNGMAAALAAQAGFTADLSLFERGFFSSLFGIMHDSTALVAQLGARSVVPELSFKPWCAAKQTIAATQALAEIVASGLAPADIQSLVVMVPSHYLKMTGHGIVPGDRTAHLTSIPYQLALSVHDPGAMFDVGQTAATVSEEIRTFMSKVTVEPDDTLLEHYPGAWPARMVLRTSTGTHERLVIHAPGDPQRPFDENGVAAKFRRILTPLIGQFATEDLMRRSSAAFEADDGAESLFAMISSVVHSETDGR